MDLVAVCYLGQYSMMTQSSLEDSFKTCGGGGVRVIVPSCELMEATLVMNNK